MAALTVLTWNLFHGRDHPPADSPTHAEVNRVLRDEFADLLAREPWDVAFLQEAPPHWLRPIARRAGAHGASALTSRNLGAFARRRLAELNPDLIASNEGGSNQVLVRGGWGIAETRRLTLTLLPERRRLLWVRLAHPDHGEVTAANLHATAGDRPGAERDVLKAARAACAWSAATPLVFGGDLNMRMTESPGAFALLERDLGLTGALPGRAIDHLLARRLQVLEAPRALTPDRREVSVTEGQVRLSDHAAVVAAYALGSAATTSRRGE
ncbi:MAG TPA: endonuclease/exonuclease/phosphatase family protein [Thermoleophilaceae bacterium]|nr:endonuclease/exonuclease/phosphatase family protein [Thermoleophilaceae bacterium]